MCKKLIQDFKIQTQIQMCNMRSYKYNIFTITIAEHILEHNKEDKHFFFK